MKNLIAAIEVIGAVVILLYLALSVPTLITVKSQLSEAQWLENIVEMSELFIFSILSIVAGIKLFFNHNSGYVMTIIVLALQTVIPLLGKGNEIILGKYWAIQSVGGINVVAGVLLIFTIVLYRKKIKTDDRQEA